MIRIDSITSNTRRFQLRKYYPFMVRHVTAPAVCWYEIPANRVRYALERLAVEEKAIVEGVCVQRSKAWRVANFKVEYSEALTLAEAVSRVCELAGGRESEVCRE